MSGIADSIALLLPPDGLRGFEPVCIIPPSKRGFVSYPDVCIRISCEVLLESRRVQRLWPTHHGLLDIAYRVLSPTRCQRQKNG